MGLEWGLRAWREQLLLIAARPPQSRLWMGPGVLHSLVPQSAAGMGSVGGTQGPILEGPSPFQALLPSFYGMHTGRLTRGRQPLCVPMWKELQDIF